MYARRRLELRREYGCDCSGPLPGGRTEQREARAILDGVEKWTGEPQDTCPWRSFYDPLVARVLRAHYWFAKGQLAVVEPEPSHRIVEGIAHYSRALSLVEYEQDKEDAANARARAEAGR